jgi:hypothetical protein
MWAAVADTWVAVAHTISGALQPACNGGESVGCGGALGVRGVPDTTTNPSVAILWVAVAAEKSGSVNQSLGCYSPIARLVGGRIKTDVGDGFKSK